MFSGWKAFILAEVLGAKWFGYLILFAQPLPKIDQLAALRTEGSVGT
jgi:hypothetical protein